MEKCVAIFVVFCFKGHGKSPCFMIGAFEICFNFVYNNQSFLKLQKAPMVGNDVQILFKEHFL